MRVLRMRVYVVCARVRVVCAHVRVCVVCARVRVVCVHMRVCVVCVMLEMSICIGVFCDYSNFGYALYMCVFIYIYNINMDIYVF